MSYHSTPQLVHGAVSGDLPLLGGSGAGEGGVSQHQGDQDCQGCQENDWGHGGLIPGYTVPLFQCSTVP